MIPRWLSDELGGEPPFFAGTVRYRDFQLVSQSDRKVGSAAAYKLPDVCRTCNNGWMSRLEVAAQPLLLPMIRGESVSFNRSEQHIVAQWCAKTTLAFDAWRPEGRILSADDGTRRFYETRSPAEGTQVLLGAFVPDEAGVGIYHAHHPYRTVTRGGEHVRWEALVITFTFRFLVMQVFHPTQPDGVLNDRVRADDYPLHYCWPPTDQFTWPPVVSVTAAALAEIS